MGKEDVMSPKKLISTRVTRKTDEQLSELAEAQGETKAHVIAQAIDREYERYRIEREKLAEAEAKRIELEKRLRETEFQLKTLAELELAAAKFAEIAEKLGQYPDPKIIEAMQSEMAEALEALERVREERSQTEG
jgi:predicted transcriptional regulator